MGRRTSWAGCFLVRSRPRCARGGLTLADRQGSEHPASSTVEPTAERGERLAMDARGVTERTADDGRARASQGRAAPNSMSAGRRPLWVWVTLKARLRELPAIVPIRSGMPDEQEGMRAVRCKGRPVSGRAGSWPRPLQRNGRHRVPGTTEDRLEATAAPELQRRRCVTTRGPLWGRASRPHSSSVLHPIGWNFPMSSCRSARSLIR